MKRDEYLKSAFDKFNKGEISAEVYDAILMNMDDFVDDEIEHESDEYESDCRYFVYDKNDNVISDGFCFIGDARDFASECKDASVIKAHNYFRDENGKLYPDGDPVVIGTRDYSLYHYFVEKTYGRYKLDWCKQRGTKPENVNEDVGVNGECYASLEEFLDNEFKDEAYMKYLLCEDEFTWWETYSQKDSVPLDVIIKFASEVREKEHAEIKEINRNVGER